MKRRLGTDRRAVAVAREGVRRSLIEYGVIGGDRGAIEEKGANFTRKQMRVELFGWDGVIGEGPNWADRRYSRRGLEALNALAMAGNQGAMELAGYVTGEIMERGESMPSELQPYVARTLVEGFPSKKKRAVNAWRDVVVAYHVAVLVERGFSPTRSKESRSENRSHSACSIVGDALSLGEDAVRSILSANIRYLPLPTQRKLGKFAPAINTMPGDL